MAKSLPIPAATDTITAVNLSRLLTRLESKLPSTQSPPVLSPFDRQRLAANLEYARQLQQKLEAAATSPGVKSRGQTLTELGAQKAVIRRLNETLSGARDEVLDESDEEEEAVEKDATAAPASQQPDDHAPLPPLPSTIRNRFPKPTKSTRPLTPPPSSLLAAQEAAQTDITASLISMAQALKQSSLQFQAGLEDEKGYLDQAKEGLDKNARGMDAAGRRVENLRRNEHVGWYWTLIYLASIVALFLANLVVLFLAPKLRWW